MKHLKVFESFSEIDSICNELGISGYSVNSDGSVDVNDDVNISNIGLKKIPLKFGKIYGSFDCCRNKLTTLEGAPIEVDGYFDCSENKLITLEGGPTRVINDFYCTYNKLTSLKGSPIEVGDEFWCYDNQLISLDGSPIEIGGDFHCERNPIWEVYNLFPDYKSYIDSLDYGYLRGTSIVKVRFKEALDEVGIEIPDKIKGWRYI